jgi:hypothetical protein
MPQAVTTGFRLSRSSVILTAPTITLRKWDVPGDGDCFFHTIAIPLLQPSIAENPHHRLSSRAEVDLAQKLRLYASYLVKQWPALAFRVASVYDTYCGLFQGDRTQDLSFDLAIMRSRNLNNVPALFDNDMVPDMMKEITEPREYVSIGMAVLLAVQMGLEPTIYMRLKNPRNPNEYTSHVLPMIQPSELAAAKAVLGISNQQQLTPIWMVQYYEAGVLHWEYLTRNNAAQEQVAAMPLLAQQVNKDKAINKRRKQLMSDLIKACSDNAHDLDVDINTLKAMPDRKLELLLSLARACRNMTDPVDLEHFASLDVEQLEGIVRLGSGTRKNCYTAASLSEAWKALARRHKLKLRDPADPTYELTEAEKQAIKDANRRLDPTWDTPEVSVVAYPAGWKLSFDEVRHNNAMYYHIQWHRPPYQPLPKSLGYVPADIETNDQDINSTVLVSAIRDLYDNGLLFVHGATHEYTTCCTVHLRKPLSYWEDGRKMEHFVSMLREVLGAF